MLVVLGLLVYFWFSYQELQGPIFTDSKDAGSGIGVGVFVYILWVQMDWSWATQEEITGYNPFEEGDGIGWGLAAVRIFGASIVVPLMEELFWRSFLIRWAVNPDFEKVAFGAFTLASFGATVVLFGLEHNLWLAGMMAGVAFNGLYYQMRRGGSCDHRVYMCLSPRSGSGGRMQKKNGVERNPLTSVWSGDEKSGLEGYFWTTVFGQNLKRIWGSCAPSKLGMS